MSEDVRPVNPSWIVAKVLSVGYETRKPDPTIPVHDGLNRPIKLKLVQIEIQSCRTEERIDPDVKSGPLAQPTYKEVPPYFAQGTKTYFYVPLDTPVKVGDIIEARTPEQSSYNPTLTNIKPAKGKEPK